MSTLPCPSNLFFLPRCSHAKLRKWPAIIRRTACGTRYALAVRATSASPTRRTANYQPSLWNDDFIQSLRIDPEEEEEKNVALMEELKKSVRRRMEAEMTTTDKVELIDTLTNLGIAYHFQKEIKIILENIHRSLDTNIKESNKEDLRATALLFRVLRDYGFDVSHDILNDFKDDSGTIKANLSTEEMLSLYEASYRVKKGEDMLEVARNFTFKNLKEVEFSISEGSLREHVAHSLDFPINWTPPRIHNLWFMRAYKKSENMDNNLLQLATMDFNMVQRAYKEELKAVSRWWNDLGMDKKLSYGRDRLAESYLCTLLMGFEPEFRNYRITTTKLYCILLLLDDTYDIYGSLDELELFTSAVERWDFSVMEELPEYMQILFLALFNMVNETAYDILTTNGVQDISFLRKAAVDYCRAILVEAKWYNRRYVPTFKEYLDNAWVSTAAPFILIYLYFGLSQDITAEEFRYVANYPDIIRHIASIFRLSDDLATSQDEGERGDVPKSIQCYANDKGVSEAVARVHVRGLMEELHKEVIGYQTSCTRFEQPFKNGLINFARKVLWLYRNGDGYGKKADHETKDIIRSLLIEPVAIEI